MWLKSQVALYRVSLTNYPLLKRNKAKQRIILSWTPWIYLYESYVSKSILNRWVLSIGVRSLLRTEIPDLLDIHIFLQRELCFIACYRNIKCYKQFPSLWFVSPPDRALWLRAPVSSPEAGGIPRCWLPGFGWYNAKLDFCLNELNTPSEISFLVPQRVNSFSVLLTC